MNLSIVRKTKEDLSNEIKDVISKNQKDITTAEAFISFDGKQYQVRFPKSITDAFQIKKRDKIKFVVERIPEKMEKLEIVFERGTNV